MKLLYFITFLFFLCGCSSQIEKIQKPSGKYLTGVRYLCLTDSSRKELFDDTGKSFREITIKAWYPTDVFTNYEPYIENREMAINGFRFSEVYRNLKSNSCKDTPLSTKESKYPVLIFSHGWGEQFSQNTILMEELASRGYIVLSIAHHYECKFSFYPDGKVITISENNSRFQKIMNEQQNPRAMDLYNKMFTAGSDEERELIFQETAKLMPTLLIQSPEYWAEDTEFIINMLEVLNSTDKILKNKTDTSTIGVFGMSMGGITANSACTMSNKIKAGVNIDGGIYGKALNSKTIVPFLFINSQRYYGYGKLFTDKSLADCYSVTIKNSDHYNLSDYALYPMQQQNLIGKIDPNIPIEILNKLIPAFFDKYMKNKTDISIDKIVKEYDAEYVKNVK